MNKKTVVIVGAGTAGLVIAGNLNNAFNIIVVEKSKYKSYPIFFKIPMMIGILFRKKPQKYITKRELLLSSGRKIPFFESQVFGGASVINGCVHTVGMHALWKDVLTKFNFSLDNLEDSYKNNYSIDPNASRKINLAPSKLTEIDKAFLGSLNKLGIPIGDMNYSNEQNCGPISNTVGKYFRTSVLSRIKGKKFLTVLNKNVDSLKFDGLDRVVGVAVGNKVIEADYVILSSGVLGTNKLLLNEVKREPAKYFAAKKIGENFQDHVNLRVNVTANRSIDSLNEIEKSFSKKIKIFFSHLLFRPNLLRGTGATSGVHLDLDGDGKVDTRIQVVQFTESGRHGSDGKYFGGGPGFSLSITPINPYSKGKIAYKSGQLIVDPGYLSDRRDIDLLISALRFCTNLLRTEPLKNYIQEIVDLSSIESDPENYIMNNIYSGHHLIGGLGEAVDENFAVKGLKNLYVCDASVFQGYVASNIHSSVVLLADLFSRRFTSKIQDFKSV